MDESLGSFKTLEQVHLKATQQVEADGKVFEPGETIAYFDKIQVAGLKEFRDYVAARGGYDNRGLVYWETTREMDLTFSQGVFSNLQFGLLNNAKVIKYAEEEPILLTKVEELESDGAGNLVTAEEIVDQVFIYDKETGEKLSWAKIGRNPQIKTYHTDVVIKYRYNYTGGASVAQIGQRFLRTFVELEGKTRVKDDTSGLITTGIIKIPKLKLMSGLSMKLGSQANPVVGNFKAVCVPEGDRHNSYVAEFVFLNDDIDSDM